VPPGKYVLTVVCGGYYWGGDDDIEDLYIFIEVLKSTHGCIKTAIKYPN